MSNKITLKWTDYGGYIEALVPAVTHLGQELWQITLVKRPSYCDRGRYHCLVQGTLDGQEGFPRYYFNLDRAKAELEDWVNARKECKNSGG